MRYMIIVKATRDSEAGAKPTEPLFARMATYHEELAKDGAGKLSANARYRAVLQAVTP
jgi:hypothetical protein